MQLPSKALRDSYGIDSFQRAIVWSALLLRSGYLLSNESAIKNAVQIALSVTGSGDTSVQSISLRVALAVDNDALPNSANILNNVVQRINGTVDWLAVSPPSVGNFLPITDEPTGLSMEAYLLWACQQLLLDNVDDYRRVQILPTFNGTADPFTLDAVVVIAFDYATYLSTNNLITSIGTATALPTVTGQLTNDLQLSNNYQLIN